jgi:hypothetical protein
MATGFEQVRSVVAHLAGDQAAAEDVRLVLPETGVCSLPFSRASQADQACCSGAVPKQANACCTKEAGAHGRERVLSYQSQFLDLANMASLEAIHSHAVPKRLPTVT